MSVASAYGMLLLLNVASPETLVARADLARSSDARPVDYRYLATLDGDAAPAVSSAIASADPSADACKAGRMMYGRWGRRPYRTFAQWNLGAARGESVVLARLTPHSLRRLCGSSRT